MIKSESPNHIRTQAWSFWINLTTLPKRTWFWMMQANFNWLIPAEPMITPQRSNLSLYSLYLYYAEAWNELTGPISASLRSGKTTSFEEISQRRQAVGNTVSDLTGPRFEPQISCSRDKRVAARPTGRYTAKIKAKIQRRLLQLSNGGVMHESVYKKIRPTAVHSGPSFTVCQKCTKTKSLFDQFYLWLVHHNTLWQNIWELLLIRFYSITQTIA